MVSFDINTTGSDVVKRFSKQTEGKTRAVGKPTHGYPWVGWRWQLPTHGYPFRSLPVVITGPSKNGIGAETAITLASANPKKIILVGRTESKVTPVIESIKNINPSIEVAFVEIDLLSNKSVRQAAEKIKRLTDKIHVLINNAGVMAVRNCTTSVDGVESQFAANYLGHFLLTNLLGKEILAAASEGARIAVLVTNLERPISMISTSRSVLPNFVPANLRLISKLTVLHNQDGKTYNPWVAYGQAKTAMILFNIALSEQLKQKGVTTLICHPGVTLESKLLVNSGVDNELFADAYALAIKRNDGEFYLLYSLMYAEAILTVYQGSPSLHKIWCSPFHRIGPIFDRCIRGSHSQKSTSTNREFIEAAPAFIVENKVYTETKDYALNKETAEGLWKLSEELVGETFVF
ncbi:short-chain dehydrogenase protein [Rutstroemia sp. NJR-2017a BVV2]|nr:short-chain dehydrogenase protein [Rutstroemia sp. NJR-2017a BVV2]